MANRTVAVRLLAEVSGYLAGIKTAKNATKDFAGQLSEAAKKGHLDAVADQAAHMGLALSAAFAGVVAITAKFDKQMSAVASVTDASAASLGRLRSAAIQAGKDTSYSATEAAKAEEELAKAGISTSDILGGALTGSLNLAAAGSLDLADAADISAKAMNIFKLKGSDVGHIADVLSAAANKSATDVHDMGEALKMGGLAAHNAGMSFEDTSGVLAAFADNALNGSDAGTSLKTMLQMLANPSDKAANLMQALGINVYDATGNFIGAAKLAGVLQRQLGTLTQEQRNAALATIFGSDATRAATVLYNLGEQGVNNYVAAVNDQGAAAATAAEKMDNLAGDVERLKGSLETMVIQSGGGVTTGLRTLVQFLDKLIGQFMALPPFISGTAVVLSGVGGAALLAFAGWAKMSKAAAEALDQLRAAGPAGARAASGLERVSRSAKIATAAFIGLQVIGAVLDQFDGSATDIDALNRSLLDLSKTGKVGGELARQFGGNLEDMGQHARGASDGWFPKLGRAIEGILPPAKSLNEVFFGGSFTGDVERYKDLDAQLVKLAQDTGDLNTVNDIMMRLYDASGLTMDEFTKLLPNATAQLQQMRDDAAKTAKSVGDIGQSAELTSQQVQDLMDAFDKLYGIQMTSDRAMIKMLQVMDETNKVLKEGSRILDVNTDVGRTHTSQILDQIDAIKDLRQANIDHGLTMQDADRIYNDQLLELERVAIQLGYDKKAVRGLIDTYRDIPRQISTNVTAPTVTKRISEMDALRAKLNALNNKKFYYYVYGEEVRVGTSKGGTFAYAKGGVVEHAQSGLLREASLYSTRQPAVYAFAEKATGGEAFIPKHGNMARSRSIWGYVGENWLGMQARPQYMALPAAPSAGPSWVAQPVNVPGGGLGQLAFEWLRNEVRIRGGELAVLNLKKPS